MPRYIIPFLAMDKTSLLLVGGKGANLGEISKITGVKVPPGFCVTTEAHQAILAASSEMDRFFAELDQLDVEQFEAVQSVGRRIRQHMESIPVPDDLQSDIYQAWETTGRGYAHAVRSSATAEDLPQASFCRAAGHLSQYKRDGQWFPSMPVLVSARHWFPEL